MMCPTDKTGKNETRTGASQTSGARVLIVDDHPILRIGLRQILEESAGMLVAEAATPTEVFQAMRSRGLDAVLLTSRFCGMDSTEFLRDLKSLYPRVPAVMLSIQEDDQFGVRALRGGASGYLSVGSSADEIVTAVRKVAGGETYMSSSLAEQLAYSVVLNRTGAPHEGLSHREFQVLRLIGSGVPISEAAVRLSLSPKTVSTYRRRVLQKMRMKTNADLIRYVAREGLIEY